MMNRKLILISATLLAATSLHAQESKENLDTTLGNILNSYHEKYRQQEYFSGVALAVYTPKLQVKKYYAGTVAHDDASKKIDADTLFQIGSISKSFTAAVILQLVKEGKVDLHGALKDWLPDYSKWSAIKINQLLNMTSCLPNYSDTPNWNSEEAKNPTRSWTNKELMGFVYPSGLLNPPLKSGYFYSNTGYILADMIVQKATGSDFKTELTKRTFNAAELSNTFYPLPTYPAEIAKRMAHGYNYNQYDNPPLVGRDMTNNNLTWAGAAGGIVSNPEDIIKWVKALFIDDKILDDKQKASLTELVSTATGKAIKTTSADDPDAFALGVSQKFHPEIGTFWFYEGETLGFRAIYMYTPCNKVIVSSIINSAVNSENDHSRELMIATYKALLKDDPALACKKL